jgi:hypothetical protein
MSKTRLNRASRKPVYLVIAFSLLLAIGYAVYKSYFAPTPANVMVIEPAPLTYGMTTISGGLHKDSQGGFVLVLPDRRVVALDVKGIDNLDGMPVTVTGNLTQALTMSVAKITLQNL